MLVDPQLRKICVWNPSFHLMSLSISPESSACVLSHLGCVQLFATPWTVAQKAPLSMEFSRQEFWSGLPFLPLGDLPDPGLEPESLTIPALAGNSCVSLPPAPPGKPARIQASSPKKYAVWPLWMSSSLGAGLVR